MSKSNALAIEWTAGSKGKLKTVVIDAIMSLLALSGTTNDTRHLPKRMPVSLMIASSRDLVIRSIFTGVPTFVAASNSVRIKGRRWNDGFVIDMAARGSAINTYAANNKNLTKMSAREQIKKII